MMRQAAIPVVLILLFAGQAWTEEQPPAPAPTVSPIEAVYRSGPIPVAPGDATWKDAPERELTLTPQIIAPPHGGGSVQMLSVRAMHNGSWLAFRLEWVDPTANREVGVNQFRDAAAVGFPTREAEALPAPFMGDVYHSLNIWQWTADFDANAQGAGGFADSYPHTEGVWYFAQDYDVQRQVRAWRGTEPVIEYVAKGFGTLTRKAAQNVRGVGRHADGHWQVVLRRELATGNPEDTLFRPGGSTQVVFAVWNGEESEVNGKKNVTLNWTPFALQPSSTASR
jgi:DMSO reductase family type II enzyme heme b subunit